MESQKIQTEKMIELDRDYLIAVCSKHTLKNTSQRHVVGMSPEYAKARLRCQAISCPELASLWIRVILDL